MKPGAHHHHQQRVEASAPVTPHPCPFDLFRDDGLSGSQAHMALNDHTSLFHQTKEQLDGSTTPPGSEETLCLLRWLF